jgi:hypothetical protein
MSWLKKLFSGEEGSQKPASGAYTSTRKATCPTCNRAMLPGVPCPFCNPQTFGEQLVEGTLGTAAPQAGGRPQAGMAGVASAMAVASQHGAPGFLHVFEGNNKGASILLGDRPVTIGRDPAENLLPLNDAGVSTRHCEVKKGADGAYLIADRGSKNGTWVNNQRVTEARLQNSDTIAFGSTRIYVGIL